MIDLSTKYLGLTLKNPLVVSSSPLTEDLSNIRKMEDHGASAVVLHSLFEEQITIDSNNLDRGLSDGVDSFAESLSYFPDLPSYKIGPDAYLELIHHAKAAVDIPIIASLNGISRGGWTQYAKKMQQAGADALELNIYYVADDPDTTAEQVERKYCDLVQEVKSSVQIPVAVKLGHSFSAFANMARKLDAAGADALVLFNRFYQPDIDLENLTVTPHLVLSASYELLLRLHWVAIVAPLVKCDIAITGGVHSAMDVLKSMMAGAKVAMMTSALLKHGIGHLHHVRQDLLDWMQEHEYVSIEQMQGSMSQRSVADPEAYARGNYLKVLGSFAAIR